MLNADPLLAVQNPVNALDVNADDVVTPQDALLVANALRSAKGWDATERNVASELPLWYLDVDGDQALTEADFETVAAALNAGDPRSSVATRPPIAAIMAEGEMSGSGSGSGGETNVSFSIEPVPSSAVDESAGFVTLRVTPSGTAPNGITAYAWGESSTAVAGEDFGSGSGSGSLDFTAEEVANGWAKDFTIEIVDDDRVELDEEFDAVLYWWDDYDSHEASTTVEIVDDDQATIDVSNGFYLASSSSSGSGEPETSPYVFEGKTMSFKLTMSKEADTDIVVNYETQDGTATSPTDFPGVCGTVTIPAGSTEALVSVPIYQDGDSSEDDETLKLKLTSVSPAGRDVIIGDDTGEGTIAELIISFAVGVAPNPPLSLNEGQPWSTTMFSFEVTSSHLAQPGEDIVVNYSLVDVSATGLAVDYFQGSPIEAIIPAGLSTGYIDVFAVGDLTVERPEEFNVVLTGSSMGAVSTVPARGIILNDDTATVTLSTLLPKLEGQTGQTAFDFDVTLNGRVDENVYVAVYTTSVTATTTGDYPDYTEKLEILEFAKDTLNQTKSFTVEVNGESELVETDEKFSVTLGSIVANGREAAISGVGTTVLATIENDDKALITIDDVTVLEGDGGPNSTDLVFPIHLSKKVASAVSLTWCTTGNTALQGVDFTHVPETAPGSVSFQPESLASSLVVKVNGDVVVDDFNLETLNVTLLSHDSGGGAGRNIDWGDQYALGTIDDNEQ